MNKFYGTDQKANKKRNLIQVYSNIFWSFFGHSFVSKPQSNQKLKSPKVWYKVKFINIKSSSFNGCSDF